MKKLLMMILALALLCSAAQATILPPSGPDAALAGWTGLQATPAVVLCESLTVLDERGDQGGGPVTTLYYGDGTRTYLVLESWDGWAKVWYSDGAEPGWVRNQYLLMDPAWYLCDADTQVYAYDDPMAPRVALLPQGTVLPIIRDCGGWVQVSLRAATGYIRKVPADTVDETWFRPEMLQDIASAELVIGGAACRYPTPEQLAVLSTLLTHVKDLGGPMAGCPFTATLHITLANGASFSLELATDSCCVYRVDGRDYQYARHLWSEEEGSPDNSCLYALFGVEAADGRY